MQRIYCIHRDLHAEKLLSQSTLTWQLFSVFICKILYSEKMKSATTGLSHVATINGNWHVPLMRAAAWWPKRLVLYN